MQEWLRRRLPLLILSFQWSLVLVTVRGRSFGRHGEEQKCDLYEGSWIIDSSYPLYDASNNCSNIVGQGFDCLKNGRPDQDFLSYRWKPSGCDLPRFNGKEFLERHRGKKLMFVGDSISNNMWQSLSCMLHSSVPNTNINFIEKSKNLLTFLFPEYGTEITWLKNGFLVDLVKDKENGRILKLDSISSGDQWKGVDTLIFNTYHWWTHTGSSRT